MITDRDNRQAIRDGILVKDWARREVIAHGTKEAPSPAASERRQIQEAPVTNGRLSVREAEVVDLRARGLSSKSIAFHLGIAEPTVRVLLARALEKLTRRP